MREVDTLDARGLKNADLRRPRRSASRRREDQDGTSPSAVARRPSSLVAALGLASRAPGRRRPGATQRPERQRLGWPLRAGKWGPATYVMTFVITSEENLKAKGAPGITCGFYARCVEARAGRARVPPAQPGSVGVSKVRKSKRTITCIETNATLQHTHTTTPLLLYDVALLDTCTHEERPSGPAPALD